MLGQVLFLITTLMSCAQRFFLSSSEYLRRCICMRAKIHPIHKCALVQIYENTPSMMDEGGRNDSMFRCIWLLMFIQVNRLLPFLYSLFHFLKFMFWFLLKEKVNYRSYFFFFFFFASSSLLPIFIIYIWLTLRQLKWLHGYQTGDTRLTCIKTMSGDRNLCSLCWKYLLWAPNEKM